MRIVSVVFSLIVGLLLSGCGEPKPADQAPITVNCSITATPNGGNVDVSVTARIHGISKAAALRRVAADLTRLADDLDQPQPPATAEIPVPEKKAEEKGGK